MNEDFTTVSTKLLNQLAQNPQGQPVVMAVSNGVTSVSVQLSGSPELCFQWLQVLLNEVQSKEKKEKKKYVQ